MILLMDYRSKENEVIHAPKNSELAMFETLCKKHNLNWKKEGDTYRAGSANEDKEIILKNQ